MNPTNHHGLGLTPDKSKWPRARSEAASQRGSRHPATPSAHILFWFFSCPAGMKSMVATEDQHCCSKAPIPSQFEACSPKAIC